jgi:hypothetical protein
MVEEEFAVAKLCDYRPKNLHNEFSEEFELFVKWQGFGPDDDTWEPL